MGNVRTVPMVHMLIYRLVAVLLALYPAPTALVVITALDAIKVIIYMVIIVYKMYLYAK